MRLIRVLAAGCILLAVGEQPSFGGKKDRAIEAQELRITELETENRRLLEQVTALNRNAEEQQKMLKLLQSLYRNCREDFSIQAVRQSGNTPSSRDRFQAQLLLNSAFAIGTSPHSDTDDAWETPPDWLSSQQSWAMFALVHITPELIEAAFDYQVEGRPSAGRKQLLEASKRRFIHPGKRAFLLVVKPVNTDAYEDEWGLALEGLNAAKLVAFGGKQGGVTEAADCGLDEPLSIYSGVVSCVFVMQDVVKPDVDPTFTVALGGVRHRIKLNSGGWVRTREAQTVRFQIEPSPVKIVQLMQDGIPWSSIEEKFIGPRRRNVSAQASGEVVDQLLGFVVDIVLKRIL